MTDRTRCALLRIKASELYRILHVGLHLAAKPLWSQDMYHMTCNVCRKLFMAPYQLLALPTPSSVRLDYNKADIACIR
jgi:hypothetical protein